LITKGFVISTPGKLRKKIGPIDANNNNVNFGNIFKGSSYIKRIRIHNTKEDTMHITLVNDLDGAEIEIEPDILYPGKYGELVVHFNSENREYGKISDEVILNVKFADKQQQGEFIINANIKEDFSLLTPEQLANVPKIAFKDKTLIIKGLNPEELRTEIIEVENIGTRDLHIRNIQTLDERFSINPTEFVVSSGKRQSFNIDITPDYGMSKIKSIITIISNDPTQSVINFTIIGEVNQPEGFSPKDMITEIQIEKAKSIMQSYKGKNEFVILDVRTKEEYNNGCLEDAVNIDFNNSDFKKMIKLMDKQKTYLVYCQSGIRSKKAVDLMNEMGFSNIYHMHEGIAGWKAKLLKLADPNK